MPGGLNANMQHRFEDPAGAVLLSAGSRGICTKSRLRQIATKCLWKQEASTSAEE
jgi:hypothetical protein